MIQGNGEVVAPAEPAPDAAHVGDVPSLNVLKGRARDAARKLGHTLGRFSKEGSISSEPYWMARCTGCTTAAVVVGPTKYPAPFYGGDAVKNACTAEPTAAVEPAPDPVETITPTDDVDVPPEIPAEESDMKTKTTTKKTARKATTKASKRPAGKHAAKTKTADASVRAGTKYDLFGQSGVSAVRWMGREGFTLEQAVAALKAHRVGIPETTVAQKIRQGGNPKKRHAEFTAEQAKDLLKYKKANKK